MKKFTIAAVAAAAMVGTLFVGGAVFNSASASTSAVSAASAVGAVGCIDGRDPHHNVKVFWTEGRICPAGHYGIADAFGSGAVGPAGPKGDKGDPGTNDLVIKHATAVFTPSSPATASLTVSGLPAYSATSGQIYGSNADALPVGVTLSVTTATPALGSTTRVFNVTGINVAVGKTFTLDVWAAAVATA